MYGLSTTWSRVTNNDQHFIRLMSMMEETRHAQCNVLNYIALCDILQTFKTFHIALNYISVMMAFRPVSLTAIAVPCFPIVKLLNQSYLDTMVIGMPTLYWENPACNKHSQFLHASRESRLLWHHIIQWKQSYGVDTSKQTRTYFELYFYNCNF